jgi:hypothetical protein
MRTGKRTAFTSSVPACVRAFLPAMPITRASGSNCHEPAVHSQCTRQASGAASAEPG